MTQLSDVQKAVDEILRLARESVKAQRATFMAHPNHCIILDICGKFPNDSAVHEAAKIAIDFITHAAVADANGRLTKSRILVQKPGPLVSTRLFTCPYENNPNDQFFETFKISRPCDVCAATFEISENENAKEKTHCEQCRIGAEMEELLKRQEIERLELQVRLQKAKEKK